MPYPAAAPTKPSDATAVILASTGTLVGTATPKDIVLRKGIEGS